MDSVLSFLTLIEAARHWIGVGAQSVAGSGGLVFRSGNNTITFTSATGTQTARIVHNGSSFTRSVNIGGGGGGAGVPVHMLR